MASQEVEDPLLEEVDELLPFLQDLEDFVCPLPEPTEKKPASKRAKMSERERHDEESSKKKYFFGEDQAWIEELEKYEREVKEDREKIRRLEELLLKS